ncbi:MAG: DNA polymerase III subunit delta [Negativicutes bacterium]|nr:DNA polymerase III subunit delta [Negativicutes bacterium]
MDYTQVMAEIKKGRIHPVYLLSGEEVFLARQVEKALVEALLPPEERDMSLAVFDRDPSAAELATLIETVPFMGGKNVIVIRGTQLFRSGRKTGAAGEDAPEQVDERLLRLLTDIPEYTRLIFMTADKADKRRKIYKAVEHSGAVVELGALKSKDVRPWVTARLVELDRKMAPDALEYLLAAVSLMPQISLGFLDREMEKLVLYAKGTTISRQELTEIMSAVPEVSVFAMIEALSQKQTGKALKLLDEQLAAGENAIRLLALLARQVRLLWRSRELAGRGLGPGQVAEQMGVPPFVGEKLVRQSRAFTLAKLKETVKALAEADWELKSGRTDKFVLERIIIEMCR